MSRRGFVGRRAFTLIELIVVVIVIAVLAAIAGVAYNQYAGDARSNSVLASASDLRTAIMAAAARDDHTAADEAALLWDQAGADRAAFLSELSAHYDGPVTFTSAGDSGPATLLVGAPGSGTHAACLLLTEPPTVHAGTCGAGAGAPAAPTGAGYTAAVLADDPATFATLSDPAGSSSSGSGTVTYTGNPVLGADAGPMPGSTAMTGTGTGYATVAAPFTAVTGAVEVWVKISSSVSPSRNLWLLGGDRNYLGLWLMGSSGSGDGPANSLCWQLNSTGGTPPSVPNPGLRDGEWHQVVLDRTSTSTQSLYVDGKLLASPTLASGTASTQLNVGITGYPLGRSDRPAIPAGVSMADVAVYTVPLSSTQVAAHYAAATS